MKITQATNNKAAEIAVLLKNAGFKPDVIPLAISQIAHETAKNGVPFNSNVLKQNNNYSGIIWINKPYQKNAVKGTQLNIKETKGKPVYYAKFNSVQDWANDYFRILSRGINKPINATDSTDFVNRLKDIGYFADAKETYLKGVNYWLSKINITDIPKAIPILPILLIIGTFFLFKK